MPLILIMGKYMFYRFFNSLDLILPSIFFFKKKIKIKSKLLKKTTTPNQSWSGRINSLVWVKVDKIKHTSNPARHSTFVSHFLLQRRYIIAYRNRKAWGTNICTSWVGRHTLSFQAMEISFFALSALFVH